LQDTLGKELPDLLPLLKEAVSWVVEMGTSDLKFHAMLDALGVRKSYINFIFALPAQAHLLINFQFAL
jgi:hypothetical protein